MSRAFFFGLRALILVSLTAALALAGDYGHTATHRTKKSVEHVLSVLTAYGQVCDSGCKYRGPGVVELVRVEPLRTATKWYTWTHVQNGPKHTKYFNEVVLKKAEDGSFVLTVRQLDETDKALVEKLTAATNKPHAPVADSAITTFTVKKTDAGAEVTQAFQMTATGFITLFPGKIASGMKESAEVTFANIEK